MMLRYLEHHADLEHQIHDWCYVVNFEEPRVPKVLKLRLDKPGKPKLVEQVDEVTFNGRVGLANGKRVFYVTDLALLELTNDGLTLRSVMPGIDIQHDLLANCEARIHVPSDPGPETIPAAVVTGEGFHLHRTDDEA